jgi:CheY-like chemotaxis protein
VSSGTVRGRQAVTQPNLAGRRVLVVEDEFLVALDIERMAADAAVEVVGPVGTLDEALAIAGSARLDGAILDVNIGGRKITPVALMLRQRGIPFILSTGYGAEGLDSELAGTPTLQKPFDDSRFAALLRQMFASG